MAPHERQRSSWWHRNGRRLTGGFAVATGMFTVLTLWYLPQNAHAHHQARDLLRDGVTVTAKTVRVHVEEHRRSNGIDVVEATFTVDGRQVTTRLAGMPAEEVGIDRRGWYPAPAGSAYAPPLQVVASRSDPTVAMAEIDLHGWRENPLPEDATVAATGGTVSLALTFLALRGGNHRGRHRT